MAKQTYTLVLKVERNVSPLEGFEPLSVWIPQEDGTFYVSQEVTKDGGVLFGKTETYWESLSDVVGDADRFVSLTLNR